MPAKRDAGQPGQQPGQQPEQQQTLGQVQFLTVAEVAAIMRVSKMTVYRLVHSGELPAVRVGRSFRVPEKAVHDYLEGAFFSAG
jgi:excisionase family DNA binding protein